MLSNMILYVNLPIHQDVRLLLKKYIVHCLVTCSMEGLETKIEETKIEVWCGSQRNQR